MDTATFLKMDIFFFITTVISVFVGALIIIVLIYVARIVRDIADITKTVKREAKDFAKDFNEVREDIKDGVNEVKETVEGGVATVQTYTKVVAGTGLVRALTTFFDALSDEQKRSSVRRARRKAKGSSE